MIRLLYLCTRCDDLAHTLKLNSTATAFPCLAGTNKVIIILAGRGRSCIHDKDQITWGVISSIVIAFDSLLCCVEKS